MAQVIKISADFFLQARLVQAEVLAEEINGDVVFVAGPVAGYMTVQEDNGPEGAALVVGVVPVLDGQDHIAALVADEVFVEGWEQDASALLEAAGAGVVG